MPPPIAPLPDASGSRPGNATAHRRTGRDPLLVDKGHGIVLHHNIHYAAPLPAPRRRLCIIYHAPRARPWAYCPNRAWPQLAHPPIPVRQLWRLDSQQIATFATDSRRVATFFAIRCEALRAASAGDRRTRRVKQLSATLLSSA